MDDENTQQPAGDTQPSGESDNNTAAGDQANA